MIHPFILDSVRLFCLLTIFNCTGNDRRGGRGGRNRSRSPPNIDQYRPGDRNRDEFHNGRRDRDREDRRRQGTPPNIDRYVPGQDQQPPAPRINPLPNPSTLDFQVGFNFFAEWWRAEQAVKDDEERAKTGRRPDRASKGDPKEEKEKERQKIQAAYDTYKEELQGKMAKTFVLQHKKEEWFKERYMPEIRDPFRGRLMNFRRGALTQWEGDLDAGVFDNFTLEGIYKNESNGAGGVIEREEGETVAAAEVLGVGDLVPSLGGEIRDESAQQPALLIKTLAPMVSRGKIEEFCREHLGEQDGGFKWLSLSDPNPQKKCHRIGWIMLNAAPDSSEMPIDRSGDYRDEESDLAEGETRNIETVDTTGTMLTAAEKALDAINSKTIVDPERGDFTCHVGVHVPTKDPRKKALWDLFSAPERVERDLELAKRIVQKFDEELGAEADGIDKVERRVDLLRNNGSLQPTKNGSGSSKRARRGDDDIDMDDESEEEGEEEEGAIDEDVDDEDLLVKKKTLDMLVEYLRRVHNFCLFCVFESDSVHELIRKCPGGHLRRPRASLSTAAKAAAKASAAAKPFPLKRSDSMTEDVMAGSPVEDKKGSFRSGSKADQQLQRAFNWVKTFEDKLLQILEPEKADLKKLGGMPLEDALNEELDKFVKQEDESKFRCKVPDCTKLFKGRDFWRKHVEKRHAEWYDAIKKDVSRLIVWYTKTNLSKLELVNTYVLDPAHIAPSRSDANSNGHFPPNAMAQAQGTPRGFNLANMPPLAAGFANFNSPGLFPNFGGQPVQMPPGWGNAQAAMFDDGNMMHGGGPMRRRGGGQNNRAGPYDRRQPRFNNNNGRLSPRGVGNGMMIPGRPSFSGDGASGVRGIGPTEAVVGRTMKSYQDLDAVAGGGSGELDY